MFNINQLECFDGFDLSLETLECTALNVSGDIFFSVNFSMLVHTNFCFDFKQDPISEQ